MIVGSWHGLWKQGAFSDGVLLISVYQGVQALLEST